MTRAIQTGLRVLLSEYCGTIGSHSCAWQLYLTVLRLCLFCDYHDCGSTSQANHKFPGLLPNFPEFSGFSRCVASGQWPAATQQRSIHVPGVRLAMAVMRSKLTAGALSFTGSQPSGGDPGGDIRYCFCGCGSCRYCDGDLSPSLRCSPLQHTYVRQWR